MLLLECLLGLIRFLLGAALFSFMNVVAWRLPRNMDPLKGRSICPRCGRILLAQPKVRRQWDRFILHAPVVGVLNRKICTARFASTLSNLYGSGVPIITTLGAARDAIGNRWIESQFGDALDSIRAGHSLSQAIAGIDGFETKLSSSIAVGEETGRLDSLLATISETLDYEAEMATKRLVTLLEPVMIVIMGIVVGGVVAAVIVPIYQSYGTIGGSSGAI